MKVVPHETIAGAIFSSAISTHGHGVIQLIISMFWRVCHLVPVCPVLIMGELLSDRLWRPQAAVPAGQSCALITVLVLGVVRLGCPDYFCDCVGLVPDIDPITKRHEIYEPIHQPIGNNNKAVLCPATIRLVSIKCIYLIKWNFSDGFYVYQIRIFARTLYLHIQTT